MKDMPPKAVLKKGEDMVRKEEWGDGGKHCYYFDCLMVGLLSHYCWELRNKDNIKPGAQALKILPHSRICR
jgi:hypothetical protein